MNTAGNRKKKKIRIGQIGLGHGHADAKMATLRKLPDEFEVVGVAEPDPEWRRQRENRPAYRGLPWLTAEQLLNIPGLQAVAVETDVPDLLPWAETCIKAGMHIHLDKPAGTDTPPKESLANFRALLEQASRRELTIQMGYMYRNNPALQFALSAARNGWLGRVFEIHCVMSRMDGPAYRKRLARFHGGAMYIFGCHLIDLVVALMGRPDRVTPYLRRTRPDQDNLYDNGLAILEYPQSTATIRTAVVEVEGPRRRQMVICGDQGTVNIRPIEPMGGEMEAASLSNPCPASRTELVLAKPCGRFHAGFQVVPLPGMPGRYDEQLIEFARIIRGETEHPYTIKHDFIVQETTLLASGCSL